MTSIFEDSLVADVMSTEVLTVGAEEPALIAWELIRQGGYHHVPVVGVDGRCRRRPGRRGDGRRVGRRRP